LRREGVADDRIVRVGNIMIDALEASRERIEARKFYRTLALGAHDFGVVTLHRPSNVDDPAMLGGLVNMLRACAAKIPLVFPVHPRTRKQLFACGLWEPLRRSPGVTLVEPVGYVDFMSLVFGARLVITDSGGIQEETTYLGIPCITLRDNTERPITVSQGTNRLMKPAQAVDAVDCVLAGTWPRGDVPELWDGSTSHRVVASLKKQVLS
jgi:UDP-N-acetylglucosamine 2-epimerase (non-hydrolysing)